MWLILLASSTIDPEYLKTLRNQVRCEQGCIAQGYDTGFWSTKKKICCCIDEIELNDLYLKKFTLKMKPQPSLPE